MDLSINNATSAGSQTTLFMQPNGVCFFSGKNCIIIIIVAILLTTNLLFFISK